MTRYRLRPAPGPEEMDALYPEPHQHLRWGYGHTLRVDCTIALGSSGAHDVLSWNMKANGRKPLIADLSCGDAAVPRVLSGRFKTRRFLGDFAYSPHHDMTGAIENTLPALRTLLDSERADLFICGETIEHLDDPDAVLAEIGTVADVLLLSTPESEGPDGASEGHLWSWSSADVAVMLAEAGWDVEHGRRVLLDLPDTLSYQLWLVTRR